MTAFARSALLGAAFALLSGPVLARAPAAAIHPAPNYHFDAAELLHPGNITKAQAIAIALKAVGGGKVMGAEWQNEDHSQHWNVQIQQTSYNFQVWVSNTGQVLRINKQPRGS